MPLKILEGKKGMSKVVLDASAFLALLNEEKGQEVVAQVLNNAVISSVNACEVAAELHEKLKMPIDKIESLLITLITEIIPFDLEQAIIAAALKPKTKELGLSLGDRACLALGQSLNLPVYTADRAWSAAKVGIDIVMIR
jgi:PIN domain nuclease of toxin-antitoxin system